MKLPLTVPNLLSILRMGLVPLFIIALLDGRVAVALAIVVTAGLTDALDGFIARYWRQQSLLGSYLDPLADKLLMTSAYVVLAIPGLSAAPPIPVWVVVLVLTRDVLILGIALVVYLTLGIRRFPPSWIGKTNTVAQVAVVILVLVAGLVPAVIPVARGAIYVMVACTVASGLQYGVRVARLERPGAVAPGPQEPTFEEVTREAGADERS